MPEPAAAKPISFVYLPVDSEALSSGDDDFHWAVGIGATLLMLVIISPNTLLTAIIDLLPALICGFLVLPIPNYHNIRIVIQELYRFYTTRQRFIWKGWCVNDEYGESKQVHK